MVRVPILERNLAIVLEEALDWFSFEKLDAECQWSQGSSRSFVRCEWTDPYDRTTTGIVRC